MTTNGSQSTTNCPTCTAAVAEAAVARVALRQAIDALCHIALSYRVRINVIDTPPHEHAQDVLERLGIDIEGVSGDTADTAIAALERRLARAEALAELVPEAELLYVAAYWLCPRGGGEPIGDADKGELANRLRALADSIEEAQREQEDGDG